MIKITINELTNEEVDILYFFVKNKYMHMTSPVLLNDLFTIYGSDYDASDIVAKLSKLTNKQYINASSHFGSAAYGIFDVSTYKKLRNVFKYRLYFDSMLQHLKNSWTFLWRHFVVTILVALITAYLYNRFSLHP